MSDLSQQAAAAVIAQKVAIADEAIREAMKVADLHGLNFSLNSMGNSEEYYGKGYTGEEDGYGPGEDSEFSEHGGWRNSSSYC
jgi:hypothetical protein